MLEMLLPLAVIVVFMSALGLIVIKMMGLNETPAAEHEEEVSEPDTEPEEVQPDTDRLKMIMEGDEPVILAKEEVKSV